MYRLAPFVLVLVALLGGCFGATQNEETTPSTPPITPTTPSRVAPITAVTTTSPVAQTTTTTTTEAALPTTTTPVSFDDGIGEIDFRDDVGIRSQHQAGTAAPVTGWVSAQTPTPVSIGLSSAHGEQLVKIGYATSVANAGHGWDATGMVHLDPGINEVPIIVEGITPPLSISVPITYLPGATVRLATVIEADEDSITLDFGYYYWSGSFGLPGDDDPDVFETVPVAPDAYVILSDELVAQYWWFLEQRREGIEHDDIGWYPGSSYTYYWATIHEGQLVELWRIPFG